MPVFSPSALVVLSGGQDSTTCLYWAKQQFNGRVHAITFDYGQRHRLEIDAARKVAEMANCLGHQVVEVPNCLISTSPLTTDTTLERYQNYQQMDEVIGDRVELTFVPMRNPLFLTIAVNRAVDLKLRNIVTGICQQDNANYPDCRDNFRGAFEMMANMALGVHDFKILAPLMWKTKAQTVQLARLLPGCWEALAYTHTSYDGKYPPTDMNHANVLRAQGFYEAQLPDPLVVRAWREGLMELPGTSNYDGIRAGTE